MQGAVDRRKTRGYEGRMTSTEERHEEMREGRPVQGAVDRRKIRGDEGRMTSAGGCGQKEDTRR